MLVQDFEQQSPLFPANSNADLFVTTDDRLIKKVRALADLTVMLPGEALAFLENWYEN
jgi:hypothetical protein